MHQDRYKKDNNEKYSHKVHITCGLWDAFRHFKSKHKFVYPKIERKEYVDICHAINKKLSDNIIKKSLELRMPFGMGTLAIKKNKMKINIIDGKLEKNKMIVDWGKTWKYWKSEYPNKTNKEIIAIKDKTVIYNMNDHTDGYIMSWSWDKTTCRIHNRSVYYFKPTKRNRLELARWIKSDERENDYYLNEKNTVSTRRFLEEQKERIPNLESASV